MIRPLYFENEHYHIHAFRPQGLQQIGLLAEDVFLILSDDFTLRYLPGKRLENQQEAAKFLQTHLMNFHTKRNYLHFITDKRAGKVVRMIDIISPELAREHYHVSEYPFFIEFYLGSLVSGCS